MQDRPSGTMVRCSKARAMFAMRACRRSVMIGKALDKPRMTAVRRSLVSSHSWCVFELHA
jgi:DNA mismatch repair protein PMS2